MLLYSRAARPELLFIMIINTYHLVSLDSCLIAVILCSFFSL